MKKTSRIWIGGIAAAATFASLVTFVGIKHKQHGCNNDGWKQSSHCAEQCSPHDKEKAKPSTQSAKPQPADTANF